MNLYMAVVRGNLYVGNTNTRFPLDVIVEMNHEDIHPVKVETSTMMASVRKFAEDHNLPDEAKVFFNAAIEGYTTVGKLREAHARGLAEADKLLSRVRFAEEMQRRIENGESLDDDPLADQGDQMFTQDEPYRPNE